MATIEKRIGKKGITYTARVRYMGEAFTKTFKKHKTAETWARRIEVQINDGEAPIAQQFKYTFNDLCDDFEANGLEKDAPNSKKIISQLWYWKSCFGTKMLNTITPATICKFRRVLRMQPTNRGESTSPATVNRYVSALSSVFQFAVEELHWLKLNPVRQVKRLPESPPPVRFLDKETELPKLTEACAQSSNSRLLPLFMLAICLGLRAGALLWLKKSEVNIEKKTIRIPAERSKNNRAFTLGISPVLFPYVKYLYDNCHPESGLLFPAQKDPFNRMDYRVDWDRALKLAGIENYRFHDNRHTCGSYLAMAGYSLAAIAELLNHKTLEMAKRYSHLADEYREKLSGRMNEEFIAEASATVVHLVGVEIPGLPQHDVEEDQDTPKTGKPYLRLL